MHFVEVTNGENLSNDRLVALCTLIDFGDSDGVVNGVAHSFIMTVWCAAHYQQRKIVRVRTSDRVYC